MFSGVLHCQRSECGQVPAPGLRILIPRNYGQTACNVQGIRREAGRHKFEPISPSAPVASRSGPCAQARAARSGRCLVGASRNHHISHACFVLEGLLLPLQLRQLAHDLLAEAQPVGEPGLSEYRSQTCNHNCCCGRANPAVGSAPTLPVNLS